MSPTAAGASIAWLAAATIGVSILVAAPPARAEHPNNGWIVWASNRRDNQHDIYLMAADGSGKTRLTTSGARMPMWSPDGRWIAYETVPGGRTRIMRWDGSEDQQIFNGAPKFWLWDGTRVVCMDTNDDLYQVDPENGQSTLWLHKSDFSAFGTKAWSPTGLTANGRWLVTWTDRYRNGYTGSNGTFNAYHSAVILDLQNKSDIFFFGQGCEPTTPPSGDRVYHVCGGGVCTTFPDVYSMNIADRNDRSSYAPEMAHDNPDWGHEYFPRISTDGTWLVFGTTTGCHDHETCDYEIRIHRIGGGNSNRERLTFDTGNDQWPHLYVGDLWSGSSTAQIALSASDLNYGAIAGGADPASQDIAVTNSAGSGTLAGVTATTTAPWLSVTRTGAGNTQILTNSVDVTGLGVGTYTALVNVDAANATNGPLGYNVTLIVSAQAEISNVAVVASTSSIFTGDATDVTASSSDQYGDPFAADVSWSVSAGGAMSPGTSGGPVTSHISSFLSDGTPGTFTVTASAGGVTGSVAVEVVGIAFPLRINSGDNAHDVAGWLRDDPFVSGGGDWTNPNAVDTSGVTDAAPAAVYASVRHQSPHAYSIGVPDGDYLVRLHFADAYTDRHMTYSIEGVEVLSDFDVTSAAGGINRALVREFDVTVAGGDGMQINATSPGDVFEAGIEIFVAAALPPTVDAGPDLVVELPSDAILDGVVGGNGGSNPGNLLPVLWSKLSGPGDVVFAAADSAGTTASFSSAGVYELQLWASNGTFDATDAAVVTVVDPGQAAITLLAPNGGEVWHVGDTENIRWSAVNVDRVIIRYSTDGGGSWTQLPDVVDTSMAGWESMPWIVADAVSTDCRVRIFDYDGGALGESAASFTIAAPGVIATGDPGDARDESRDIVGVLGCAQTGGSSCAGLLLLVLVLRRRRRILG